MVHFKVVKGSHLLLGIAVVALLAVVLFISLQAACRDETTVSNANNGAKVEETFASAISDKIRIEVIPDVAPTEVRETKSILIYHTHTHEAYEQDSNDPYEAIETWRTTDQEHSVVRVGSALADELRKLGFSVTHDVTDHELEDLSNSYVRSLETLENYTEDFDLRLDLHRDAYIEGMISCLTSDKEYAQMMILIGRGDNHQIGQKPDYETNLDFAQKLTNAMNKLQDGICRNVTVKKGRYNQHTGTPSILIEFGHNKNSLQQAMNSVPIAAQAIADVLNQKYGNQIP